MSQPQPLKEREQALIERYSYCQLEMTPQRFYAKWLVNFESFSLNFNGKIRFSASCDRQSY